MANRAQDAKLPALFVRTAASFVRSAAPLFTHDVMQNKVVLLHVPTSVRVECHETRSLEQNRKIARKLLQTRLDERENGELSKSAVKGKIKSAKKSKSKAKAASRRRKKEAEKTEQTEQTEKLEETRSNTDN